MKASLVLALAIDPATPATAYAGAVAVCVFKRSHGGGRWSAVNTGLTGQLVGALAIDPATPATLYAGTGAFFFIGGGLFKSTNGGGSWSASNTGIPIFFNIVDALAINPVTPDTLYA